jgi:ferredoxin
MRLLFVYFSGTGNTHFVAHYLADRLAGSPSEIELRSMEWQAARSVSGFDLLAVGFPVYAGDSPPLVQAYLEQLPDGEGRGAFVFCTKGAYAAGAVRRNLQRLVPRGFVPLAGGTVSMPGSDGLAMVSRDSWMVRKALEKDYDHLQDADHLAKEMGRVMAELTHGRPVEALRIALPSRFQSTVSERLWALLYRVSEQYARDRLHADDRCQGCGLCVRICPVDNIEMGKRRPQFADLCVLCLRCLHACPEEAIQIGRLTIGKFRWHGPKGGFSPLRLRPEGRNGRPET